MGQRYRSRAGAAIARLSASRRAGGAAPAAAAAPARVEGLGDADQAAYAQAQQELAAGRLAEAWAKAEPLFGRHPKVYEVQELRCQLAMKRGGSVQQVQSHCERLLKLTEEMTKRSHPK